MVIIENIEYYEGDGFMGDSEDECCLEDIIFIYIKFKIKCINFMNIIMEISNI
jgi:hypothetical protein